MWPWSLVEWGNCRVVSLEWSQDGTDDIVRRTGKLTLMTLDLDVATIPSVDVAFTHEQDLYFGTGPLTRCIKPRRNDFGRAANQQITRCQGLHPIRDMTMTRCARNSIDDQQASVAALLGRKLLYLCFRSFVVGPFGAH